MRRNSSGFSFKCHNLYFDISFQKSNIIHGIFQRTVNFKLKNMKKKFLKYSTMLALLFTLSFTPTTDIQAQCPMCKIAAESNLKEGGTAGKGLNRGILYMFSMPYLIVAILGFVWWRNNRKREEDDDPIIVRHTDFSNN